MNKFSRLFQDRQLAAKAKAKEQLEANPVAAAIAAASTVAPETANEAKEASDNSPPVTANTTKKPAAKTPKKPVDKATPSVKLQPRSKVKSRSQVQPTDKAPPKRKRGRPANGKRSNPGWYGRTFYIRKQTDDLLEEALFKLRRSGIDLDKSQLVDALLNAWAQVELDQAEDVQIGEILEKPDTD